MAPKKRGRLRMPTKEDVGDDGMVLMQVIHTPSGKYRPRRVPAVDARELILADAGSLDIDPEIMELEDTRERNRRVFKDMELDELRVFCKRHNVPFAGKDELALALLLADANVDPDEDDDTKDEE